MGGTNDPTPLAGTATAAASVLSRLSVWAPRGTINASGTATLEPDQYPGRAFVASRDDVRFLFTLPPGTSPWGAWLSVATDGFVPYRERVVIADDLPDVTLDPARRTRRGVPRLSGRVFSDDDGAYLAVGVSLFWAAWGVLNDRPRLETNLKTIDRRPEYIRVLMAVGPGGMWDTRTITMQQASDRNALAQLADLAYDTYGIRIMPTLFGGCYGTSADRQQFVRSMAAQAQGREHKIHHWEIANEATKNGFTRDEVQQLGTLLRGLVPHAVALTANVDDTDVYEGTAGFLRSAHLDRNITGTGGVWRPVRQARDEVGAAWTSNEPIGIASSVAADDNALRLAMGAACTWICNGAGYVLHSGAGIYGVSYDGPTGHRSANLADQPTFMQALDAILAVRGTVPADLPNWQWENNNSNFPNYPFDVGPLVDESAVLRSFVAHAPDGRFVCAPIRIARDTPYVARRAMSFDHVDAATMTTVAHADLNTGERYVVAGTPDGNRAALLIGRYR